MYDNLHKRDENLQNEEHERKRDIEAATARKDFLQKQIDDLETYNNVKTDTEYKKG